ncbi:ABC transporter ATP-binding protein [Lentisalinibacter sediminis]|uniref:ABC transporter ATP-binding protein n=1 Tax=Lentisalinibacter sediminis TaxID=2992237 RepID=UPI00386A436A
MRALSIRDLRKVYPNGVEALKGINFEVEEGDFYALLGPNGAGKTTAIGIITSLVNKTSGDVRIYGHSIDDELEQAKACLGLVPQEINLNLFEKVLNTVVNQGGYYGLPRKLAYERAERYLTELKLWDRRNDIARNLSGGMKRRLMIARALVHEPKLLILDEPTAGVDIEIRRSMWNFLQKINAEGTTIILTTHYLEEAESLCRHVAIIDEGRIIEDASMADVLRKLNREVFVLTPAEPLDAAPRIEPYELTLRPDGDLEVMLEKRQSLNEVFAALSDAGVRVLSMRNKANRLEELFMGLVENKGAAAEMKAAARAAAAEA